MKALIGTAALLTVLAVAPVLGALAAAVAYGVARGVAVPWEQLGFDIGMLLAMILAFVGLGFFIASVSTSVDVAQTAAFLLWLVLILGLDLLLLGVLIRDRMPIEGVVAIALLNPLQVFRIGSMVLFDPQLLLLGSTAYAVFDVFGRTGFMIWSLVYPAALGLGSAFAGYLLFRRGDLL